MNKSGYSGTPVHLKIGGKKYFCLAWYPIKAEAVERANKTRKKGLGVRVIKGAPWGYPNDTVYMVYVTDHTKI